MVSIIDDDDAKSKDRLVTAKKVIRVVFYFLKIGILFSLKRGFVQPSGKHWFCSISFYTRTDRISIICCILAAHAEK